MRAPRNMPKQSKVSKKGLDTDSFGEDTPDMVINQEDVSEQNLTLHIYLIYHLLNSLCIVTVPNP